MIGAMPAVAVRHERRKEKRRRPSQLIFGRSGTTPTPTPSPPGGGLRSHRYHDYYVCGKVSTLHIVVGSILMGGVILVVGLVQLSPGAEAAQHRYYLLGAGAALLTLGIALICIRCYCVHCYRKMTSHNIPNQNHRPVAHPPAAVATKTGVNSIDGLVSKHQRVISPSEIDTLIKQHAIRDT